MRYYILTQYIWYNTTHGYNIVIWIS